MRAYYLITLVLFLSGIANAQQDGTAIYDEETACASPDPNLCNHSAEDNDRTAAMGKALNILGLTKNESFENGRLLYDINSNGEEKAGKKPAAGSKNSSD